MTGRRWDRGRRTWRAVEACPSPSVALTVQWNKNENERWTSDKLKRELLLNFRFAAHSSLSSRLETCTSSLPTHQHLSTLLEALPLPQRSSPSFSPPSSADQMSFPPSPCELCGTSTTSRCGKCEESAFCSVEHQKMVRCVFLPIRWFRR
jgi:hypothetical protein